MSNKNVIISKYMPITLNMQVDIKSIFDSESNVKLTTNIDYPKCSFGFHHYIHSLKKDTEVLKQFENKKKVYLVTNQFEIEVDKYDDSIKNKSIKYFNIKDKVPDIVSFDFYKIWEILFMFDLVDISSSIKSLHLSEDGSNVQSIINFREKFTKDKGDVHYVLKGNEINNKVLNYYDKKIIQADLNGIKDKIDLITIGSSFNFHDDNENTIEQEYYNSIFENIFNSVKIQKKGGNMICKFFETYTDVSAKLISILISLYDKVFFIKPMTSKPSTSEKYIVCIGFKFSDTSSIVKKLEKIKETIDKNNKLKICDLFTSYKIDNKIKLRLIKLNELTSNKLFQAIGEIVNFINGQDYYGDTYEKYREKQIEANKYWTDTFLPDPTDFKEMKKKIIDASFLTNKINVDEAIELEKKLHL
jgi:hypothetical protein